MLIVTAGDAKIDNSKFKAMFHTKAKMLSPEQVYSFTGHAVGGVCPLPTRTGCVPTWMCPSSASRLSSPRRVAATPRSSSPVTSWRSTPTAWDGSTCARAGRRPPDPVFPSERSALFPWRQKDCILTRRSVRKFTDRKVEHRRGELFSLGAPPPPPQPPPRRAGLLPLRTPKVLEEICRTYAPLQRPDHRQLPPAHCPDLCERPLRLRARTVPSPLTGRRAGSTTTAALPARPSAWPPTTWGWAPWSWASLTGKAWRRISRFRRIRS